MTTARSISNDEIFVLVTRWRDHRDQSARDLVVEKYLPLAKRWAGRYPNGRASLADARQECTIGILLAIDHWKPELGPFGPYVVRWVRMMAIRVAQQTLVCRGASKSDRRAFYGIGRAQRRLLAETGEASPAALALAMGVPIEAVERTLALSKHARSLDAPISGGDDASTYGELLACPSPSQEHCLGEAEEHRVVALAVARALSRLGRRERAIVCRRVLADRPESLAAIGASYGLSRERIRQIEARAMDELRRMLRHDRDLVRARGAA